MKLKKANTESCTWDGIDSYRGWEPTGWRAAVQKRFCNIMKDKSIMCKLLVNAERKKKKRNANHVQQDNQQVKAEFISLFSFIFFHTRETGDSPLEGQ